MAEIKLVRIDFRLVHGQVVTQWVKVSGSNRIVIANDALAADDFMAEIYRMAAPAGIAVDTMTIDGICDAWKQNELGEGKVLVLFKSAEDALAARRGGFAFDDVQVGGLGGDAGRVGAPCGIAFNRSDVETLRALAGEGVNVHVHVVPSQADTPLEQAVAGLAL